MSSPKSTVPTGSLRLVSSVSPANVPQEAAASVPEAQDRRVKYLLQKIHADITQTYHVKDLAQEVGLSPDYVERLFHTEMGQGIIQYIQQVRLLAACELLMTSFLSITEIAQRVGFQRSSYFAEVFHAHYHLSPSAYRKRFAHRAGQKFRFGNVKEMSEM